MLLDSTAVAFDSITLFCDAVGQWPVYASDVSWVSVIGCVVLNLNYTECLHAKSGEIG